MTIPIIPGPFSFLTGAADIYGNYMKAKETKRQQMLKEDMMTIQQLLSMNAQGIVGNKAFAEPGVLAALHRIGANIGQNDILPKLEETISGAQSNAAQDIMTQGSIPSRQVTQDMPGMPEIGMPSIPMTFNTGGSTDEQVARKDLLLSTGKIPTTASVTEAVTAAKIARKRAAAIDKGGSQEAAVTQVPSDEQTAIADEAAKIPLAQSFSNTAAMAAATQNKGLITDKTIDKIRNDAWQIAIAGAAQRGYQVDEARDRPYVDAAVEKVRQDQQEIEIKRMAAAARSSDDYIQLMSVIERENARVTSMLNALPEVSQLDKIYAGQVEAAIAKDPNHDKEKVLATLSPMVVQGWQRVNDDKALRQWLMDTQAYRQNQLGVIESARTGQNFNPPPAPGAPGAQPRSGINAPPDLAAQAQINYRASTMLKSIIAQRADVEKTITAYAGKLDPAVADAIRRLAKAQNYTGAKP